ncbi:MAG: hypothetical protein HQK89_15870 [Nitrospirae bacterium]|nr:hypothetical protein [Nitrospirota bacterium]
MTRLVLETDNDWTKRKIRGAVHTEIELLGKSIRRTQNKVKDFEAKYGKLDRSSLYGRINDMELLEWEGELETLERLNEKLKSLEEITIESMSLT